MKLLSIIIPIYNAEKYLQECIDSIVNEIDDSIELILVDDGSTDSSSKIYSKYENDNVKIYKNENHGVSYSRNFGIDNANGKYVCFVDADDFMTSGWSKRIMNVLKKDTNDFIIMMSNLPENITEKNKLIDCIFKLDGSARWISAPWSKLYSREMLNKNNIRFKEDVINGEDMLFNASVALVTTKISYYNCNIYNYRINSLSVTQTFKSKIFKSDQMFLKYLKEMFKEEKIYMDRYYNHCLENAIVMFAEKISLLKKKNRYEYYYIFSEEPYKTFVNQDVKFSKKINDLVINNIKRKKYDTAIILMELKRKVRKILKPTTKGDYIIIV